MRHTYASSLLQEGIPITYVSRQLGHKDSSTTLRVYAHWLPDLSQVRLVDVLDDKAPNVTQTSPAALAVEEKNLLSAAGRMVSLTFPSWNQIAAWLRQLDRMRAAG